jgi:hypothetical protein
MPSRGGLYMVPWDHTEMCDPERDLPDGEIACRIRPLLSEMGKGVA